MIDKQKIKIMTQVAIYEKETGIKDKDINGFFRSDYIFINNWKTRISVTIAYLLIISWDIFYKIYNKKIDIMNIDAKDLIIKYSIMFGILIFGYTILSTYIYKKRYNNAQRRLEKYNNVLKKLERYDS